jgi:endonuclease G, mitochondrial
MAGVTHWGGLFLLLLAGLSGCKAKPPPPVAPAPPPAIYAGDRTKDGGLLQRQRTTTPTEGQAGAGVQVDSVDDNMALGNPDGATENPRNRESFLIKRPQYALSYNDSLRYPNWVSWKLEAEDIGDLPRGQFSPDPDLPFRAVTHGDYTGSGYDRGHNCPSKDRSARKEDNDIVFYMTNMTPQLHEMNAGPWERLESYTRTLVQQRGMTCYVLCGHAGREQGRTRGGVSIPAFGWKVVVATPRGQAIDARARVIAVKMPNDDRGIESDPWDRFTTTVEDLEAELKMPLLSGLPKEVADALRTKRDGGSGSFGGEAGTQRRRRRNSGGSFGR